MADKIKTSLSGNVNLNYNANVKPTNHIYVRAVDKQKDKKEVDEIFLNLDLLTTPEAKAVEALKNANIGSVTVDMIESYNGNVIKLKNGTQIIFDNPSYTNYEHQAVSGKVIDSLGNEYIFLSDGIHGTKGIETELSKISSTIHSNQFIEKLLNSSFQNATDAEKEAFIKQIQDNFSLYEGSIKQILEQYYGKEKEFSEKFGFPLYILGTDGTVRINYETLAVYLAKMVWNDYYGFTDLKEINEMKIQSRPEAGNQLLQWMPDGTIGINSTNYPITSLDEWNDLIPNFYGEGNLVGQCTWFASRRYYQTHGVTPVENGHAGTWLSKADPNHISSTPKKHSVMVLGSGDQYGHVAFVEDVKYDAAGNVTSITISEGNVGGSGDNTGPTIAHAKEMTRVKTYSSVQEYAGSLGLSVKGYIY